MHFHDLARCRNCGDFVQFDTPLPDILILASVCQHCGVGDLIGAEVDAWCIRCMSMHYRDVERQLERNAPNSPLPPAN